METVYKPEKSREKKHKCYGGSYNRMVDKNHTSFHEVKRCSCGKLWMAVSRTYANYWHMTPLRPWHRLYWKIDRSEA